MTLPWVQEIILIDACIFYPVIFAYIQCGNERETAELQTHLSDPSGRALHEHQ